MAAFTYPAWDLLTMTALDVLPYTGVSFGEVLNQPGPWNGSLPVADPRVQALSWRNASRPGRTLLCVDVGGVLVWGGILWTRRYSDKTASVSVGAMEVGSYFTRRLQALDYSTTWIAGADPMAIAKRTINDAQSVPGGVIANGVVVILNPVGGSGQTVQATYPGTQLQTVESIVSNLAQMGFTFGFDYSFDVAYLPGTKTPAVVLNLWYPRKGRSASDSQIVLLQKNIVDFTYDEDATQQATSVSESGGSTGGIQPVKATAAVPGYPLTEVSISRSDIIDQGILSNIAFGDLEQLSYPVVTPTVTIPVALPDSTGVTSPALLGLNQFSVGDNLIWRVDPLAGGGENTTPRFPDGMYFEWRINQWLCTVVPAGVSTILFDLAIPLISTIPPPQAPL